MPSILCVLGLVLALATPARADHRIDAHLHAALAHVRARDVSGLPVETRARRAAGIAALERYIARGEFPVRTDDAYAGRRPRFIDARGVHCAVGQLIADSGAPELARAINATHEYAYVRDIAEPALLAWATANGFTVDELAMIQPSYDSPQTPESMRNELLAAVDKITLQCAANHPAVAKLAIRVAGDDDGRATVTTTSTDPFARCFTAAASQLEQGRGAYDSSPQVYAFTLTVAVPDPQTLLAKRLTEMPAYSDCTFLPGPIPRSATYDVRTSVEGVIVEVVTVPKSPEISACLEREYTARLHAFGPGTWKLAARGERTITPRLASEHVTEALKSHAPSIASDCATGPNPPTRVTITVTAKTDDKELTVTTNSKDAAFARCLRPRLQKSLREGFAVGTRFRIDTDVRATATIPVEFPAARDARIKRMREEMKPHKYR